MFEMTPARIVATLAFAIAALFAAYLLIMWLADRAIDALNGITQHERRQRTRRVAYQARCSTVPDMTRTEFVTIVFLVLLLGGIALCSSTWLGQEFLEYLARVFLARPG